MRTRAGSAYLAAFSTRFVSTCSTLSASASTQGRSGGNVDLGSQVGVGHRHLLDDPRGHVADLDRCRRRVRRPASSRLMSRSSRDQPGDPVGVVLDLAEHHLLLVVGEAVPAVQQQRRVALDRRERAAQLVADRGHDLHRGGGRIGLAAAAARLVVGVAHPRALRWRADSKHTIAPAVATFSDSTLPAMGIETIRSRRLDRSDGSPWASLPRTTATGPDRSTWS